MVVYQNVVVNRQQMYLSIGIAFNLQLFHFHLFTVFNNDKTIWLLCELRNVASCVGPIVNTCPRAFVYTRLCCLRFISNMAIGLFEARYRKPCYSDKPPPPTSTACTYVCAGECARTYAASHSHFYHTSMS